jgi:hypothetical protein
MEKWQSIKIPDSDRSLTLPGGTPVVEWQGIKTKNFPALHGKGYFVDTSRTSIEAVLPPSPYTGEEIIISVIKNGNTFTLNGNGNVINGAEKIESTVKEDTMILRYKGHDKGWETSHRVANFTGGFDPIDGFYLSKQMFDADFGQDLDRLGMAINGEDTVFDFKMLRSLDGTDDMYTAPSGRIDPAMYSYTPAYHSSQALRALCDWFQCDKARIRIMRQLPGQHVQLHHDFDNTNHNPSNPKDIVVRILVNLTDTDSYFNLINRSCDMTVKMQKGQFVIMNADTVWHATRNDDKVPRNTLNMIVKWNDWLRDITRPKETLTLEKIKV